MFYYFVWVGNETFAHWRQLPGSLWAGVCDFDQFWSLAGRVAQSAEAIPNFSLKSDIIIRQFSVDCCQYAFASGAPPRTPLGAYSAPPPTRSWERLCIPKKVSLIFFSPMTCLNIGQRQKTRHKRRVMEAILRDSELGVYYSKWIEQKSWYAHTRRY